MRTDRSATRASVLLVVLWLLTGCEHSAPVRRDASGLDSTSADVRRESANALRAVRVTDAERRKQTVRRLSVMAQSDPEPLVRSAALFALTTQDVHTALDMARRVRTDRSAIVRRDAVIVLGGYGDEGHVDVLIEIAEKDFDADVRAEATRALGQYNVPRVIHTLIGRLDDSESSVRHAAREGLIRLSGGTVDFGANRAHWETWWQ